MTDDELLILSRKGFFPGPKETEEDFLARIKKTGKYLSHLGGTQIPPSHWDWARERLRQIFDFEPESLPAFYSNRLLTPWQGAAAWIVEGRLVAIQLRESLKKGSYLGIYNREEVLAHEAVHAARSGFEEGENEEFFAYLTSNGKWRRVLGPIVRRPWEIWPFLAALSVGLIGSIWNEGLFQAGFFAASCWAALGALRLVRQHRILRKSAEYIQKTVGDERKTRAILVRLTDSEIRLFARAKKNDVSLKKYAQEQTTLRWRLLRLYILEGV